VIEKQGLGSQARPLVWLRDHTEAFMVHVQGSARACLKDDEIMRLTYDGRNGLPYTSIGKHLTDRKLIPAGGISLEQLKTWLREDTVRGLSVMHENSSFIFFKHDPDGGRTDGPVGGASIRLTALRSIAIDRSLWPYGLPFWIEAEIPWTSHKATSFTQLMIAQDTGSAILGAARADIFFGSGRIAGERAGDIRHNARFTVLLPKDDCE
jgi:membrane-bound lytic murein transglycosylase A